MTVPEYDRLTAAQLEASCDPCLHDEHEECLLVVRVDGIPTACACGCLKDGRGRE